MHVLKKYIPTSSTAAAKSKLTINDLEDDSVGVIFNKLAYRERVCAESVCKGWRDFSEANWCSYSKHLIIGKDTFPSLCGNTPEKKKNILEKVHYLETISFWGDPFSLTYCDIKLSTIKRIVECCPKLKCLDTELLNLSTEDWFACITDGCGELRELFRRNKRLRCLKMIFIDCMASDFRSPRP